MELKKKPDFGYVYGVYIKSKLIYIGQTINPKQRFYSIFGNALHLYFAQTNYKLDKIIHLCLMKGIFPKFKILKKCPANKLRYFEKIYIKKYKSTLINLQHNTYDRRIMIGYLKERIEFYNSYLIEKSKKQNLYNLFVYYLDIQLSFIK